MSEFEVGEKAGLKKGTKREKEGRETSSSDLLSLNELRD